MDGRTLPFPELLWSQVRASFLGTNQGMSKLSDLVPLCYSGKRRRLNDIFQHGVWFSIHILESLAISTVSEADIESHFIFIRSSVGTAFFSRRECVDVPALSGLPQRQKGGLKIELGCSILIALPFLTPGNI